MVWFAFEKEVCFGGVSILGTDNYCNNPELLGNQSHMNEEYRLISGFSINLNADIKYAHM